MLWHFVCYFDPKIYTFKTNFFFSAADPTIYSKVSIIRSGCSKLLEFERKMILVV